MIAAVNRDYSQELTWRTGVAYCTAAEAGQTRIRHCDIVMKRLRRIVDAFMGEGSQIVVVNL